MVTFVHAKDTYISVDGDDLSAFTNTSELDREADEHDVTCYGADAHDYEGGLLNGTGSLSGIYDSTANGPRGVLRPLLGTKVTVVRRPEGTGTGKPQDSVTALIRRYVETNPVADMVAWSCEIRLCGNVTSTTQS